MHGNKPVDYTAAHYDAFTSAHVRPYDKILLSRLQEELAAIPAPKRLLDVGAGTGQILLQLAALPYFQGLHLLALEYFMDMVAATQENFAKAGVLERASTVAADAHALPFASGSMDCIISRSTLHHWEAPAKAMAEMHRVLAPGGVAIIHDVRRNPAPEALEAFNQGRLAAGVGPAKLEGKHTPEEVQEMLREVGIHQDSHVSFETAGPYALGFEVRIQRSEGSR